MSVPEEIRKVPRPVNTIVVDNGREGPNRYAVRERTAVKYIPGGNPQPQNGRVIGHIVDGRFVSVSAQKKKGAPEALSWGLPALIRSVSADVLGDLLDLWPAPEAHTILAAAALRVARPSIPAEKMAEAFAASWLSRFYPDADLSGDSVRSLCGRIDADGARREAFFRRRAAAAGNRRVLLTAVRRPGGQVPDLASYPGGAEIPVICACDLERGEPVCAEVLPGGVLTGGLCCDFFRRFGFPRGVVMADGDVTPGQVRREPELHFLLPAGRREIRDSGLLNPEAGTPDPCRKAETEDGRFLYAFPDGSVWVSDLDLEPETASRWREERRMEELVFQRCDTGICPEYTAGSVFFNFITALTARRVLERAREARLLEHMTFGELMEDLSSARRRENAPPDPVAFDRGWYHTPDSVTADLVALGLCAAKKGRGRKRKH